MIKNKMTHNIDKLPLEVVGMLDAVLSGEIGGFENVYMVEIKLDDPIKHIKNGDDCFIMHQSLDQYMHHALHKWDKEWAIMHRSIVNSTDIDKNRFKTLLKKYFKSGVTTKTTQNKTTEAKRARSNRF